jgi:hypothetical protein
MTEKNADYWKDRALKAEAKNKKKKQKEDEFVSKNLEKFAELLDPNKEFMKGFGSRYYFARKDRNGKQMENVIKLNKLIHDLLEAKIRLNDNVEGSIAQRLSMDKGSLIRSLGGQRASKGTSDPKEVKELKRQLKVLEAKIEKKKSKPAKTTSKETDLQKKVQKELNDITKIQEQKAKPTPTTRPSFEQLGELWKGVERTPDGKKVICPYPSHDRRSDQWLDEHPQIDADLVVFKD